MGRFNAQKTKTKRERNLKKQQYATKQNSTLKTRHQALTIQCAICKASFLPNTGPTVLEQHRASKHDKLTIEQCFPPQEESDDEGDDE